MTGDRIRVRANLTAGELELEGPPDTVSEWWERLWPEVRREKGGTARASIQGTNEQRQPEITSDLPEVFGEYYTTYRSDVTDVDKVLVAAAFVQAKESDRSFTTKAANQLLIDQNVRVANASENVRRLMQTKRVFVLSGGKYRVSEAGFEHLRTLKN